MTYLRHFARLVLCVHHVTVLRRQRSALQHIINGRPSQIASGHVVRQREQRSHVLDGRQLVLFAVDAERLLEQLVQVEYLFEAKLRIAWEDGGDDAQQFNGELPPFRLGDVVERLLDEQREGQFAATHAGQGGHGGQMVSLGGERNNSS